MSSEFQRLDLRSARAAMENLFEQVLRSNGRVEVTRGDGQSCVLISKAELESLERALEILAESDGCKQMQKLVADVASRDAALEPVSTVSA